MLTTIDGSAVLITDKAFVMRVIKIILSVILLILIIIFSFQNMGIIVVKLFNWSLSLPTAIVIILAYILGMMTGGMLSSLLRSLITSPVPERDKLVNRP